MSYSIDFAKISLEQFETVLSQRNFIPSRFILKEKSANHFAEFRKAGIKTLDELFKIIKDKKSLSELLKNRKIAVNYVSILLRELNSIQSKPIKLCNFTWIDSSILIKLEKAGIANSKILYEQLGSRKSRHEFLETHGIEEWEVIPLLKLCDLVRIQWVNTTFARILYETGYDTVAKVSSADYNELYGFVKTRNQEMKLYRGIIGVNDIKLCIEATRLIDAEIEI